MSSQIALEEKAYELWRYAGCPEGRDLSLRVGRFDDSGRVYREGDDSEKKGSRLVGNLDAKIFHVPHKMWFVPQGLAHRNHRFDTRRVNVSKFNALIVMIDDISHPMEEITRHKAALMRDRT